VDEQYRRRSLENGLRYALDQLAEGASLAQVIAAVETVLAMSGGKSG
jgi:hypothetical protein